MLSLKDGRETKEPARLEISKILELYEHGSNITYLFLCNNSNRDKELTQNKHLNSFGDYFSDIFSMHYFIS